MHHIAMGDASLKSAPQIKTDLISFLYYFISMIICVPFHTKKHRNPLVSVLFFCPQIAY